MFADDKSIENFQQLFFEFKKYLELQKEYTKLELTEKLTILLSTLIMIVILIILGMVALFYLLFALAYVLEPDYGFSHYFPQTAYHLPDGKLPR